MSDQSTNLGLPFLMPAQAQKHVTVNESLLRLDALVHLAVESAATATQPGSPSDGQRYILPAGKTGAQWGAMANGAVAYYRDGAWEQLTPREGWYAWVSDTDETLVYDGAAWVSEPIAIPDDAVTFAKLLNATQPCFIGATGAGNFAERTYAETRADLDLEAGTNFYSIAAADSAIAAAVAAHAAAGDPHPAYALESALGALAALNSVGASQIDNDAVTFDKLLNATQRALVGASAAGNFSEIAISADVLAALGAADDAALLAEIGAMPLAGGTFSGTVTSQALQPSADNAYDLGVSATRYKDFWLRGNATIGGSCTVGGSVTSVVNLVAGAANFFYWSTRTRMSAPADGQVRITNNAQSGFDSVLFGPSGTTYTRFKHAGAGHGQWRLSDDSDFAFLQAKLRAHANAASETITPDSTILIYDAAGTAYKVPCVAA